MSVAKEPQGVSRPRHPPDERHRLLDSSSFRGETEFQLDLLMGDARYAAKEWPHMSDLNEVEKWASSIHFLVRSATARTITAAIT